MNKMDRFQKQFYKIMARALDSDGYFINTAQAKKGIILVMAANPIHDTLLGVWRSLEQFSNIIEVVRCPDPNVIMVTFRKE